MGVSLRAKAGLQKTKILNASATIVDEEHLYGLYFQCL